MILFIYILGIILLFRFSYSLNNKILFSPSFMCCASFVVACIFLFILKDDWNVNFSGYTVFLILIGLTSMLLGEHLFSNKRKMILSSNYKVSFANVSYIDMNITVVFLIILINYFASYIYYQDVIRIIGRNVESLSADNMADYKNAVVFEGEKVSRITTQLNLITKATSFVFMFIFIFNLLCGYHSKKNYLYVVGSLPNIINSFLAGARLDYITFASLLLWFIYFIKISNGFTHKSYKKFLIKFGMRLAVIGVGVLVLFYFIRLAVGRANTEDMSFKEYIGEYIAAPSLNFEHYLNVTEQPDPFDFNIHRSETFLGIGQFLSIFDKEINRYNPLFGFRSGPHGEKFGNVYTAFARYYSDFGVIGVLIFPFLIGCVLMKILSSCLNVKNQIFNSNIIFKVLVFGYLVCPLIVYAADDYFFRFFRHGTIEIILFLYFFSKYTIKIYHKVL